MENVKSNSREDVKQNSTFFISHAGRDREQSLYVPFPPMDILREWQKKVMKEKPKSILIVSPHWDTISPTVTIVSGLNSTFYDFAEISGTGGSGGGEEGGPQPQWIFRYCLGELLIASGFDGVEGDATKGLDHGSWIPLLLMYPEADVPVCQLSIQGHMDATHHYNLGKALAPLKDEGVLIIGSGNATHYVAEAGQAKGDDPVAPWAQEFDTWLMDALLQGRYEDVNEYMEKAPHAKRAHPSPDHIYPLHVAMGAASDDSKAQLINHAWDYSSLSFASYRFASTTAA